ncbi:MAG: hypothetical protein JXQ73_11260 [Phycisphaerae bacterium]|nr:hypothetical protein [Phycisphaerae bacterium]
MAGGDLRHVRFFTRCVKGSLAFVLLTAVGSGCGFYNVFMDDCLEGVALPPAPAKRLSSIALALRYLAGTQFETDQTVLNRAAYGGDWPQCYTVLGSGLYTRDTNPFLATYIHHALALVRGEHRDALGLTDGDVEAARNARTSAVGLMRRFETGGGGEDAGTFGFWPVARPRWAPGDLIVSTFINSFWTSWQATGDRQPVNVSFFPANHSAGPDSDDTASIHAALLDHHLLDGGPAVTERFERFLADWRDLGQVPLGDEASWLDPNEHTGAFLTWLTYRDPANRPSPNHVDVVVNANILYALGRYGRLNTPGVTEAVALINRAIQTGVHRSNPHALSFFYPNNLALHYSVVRACYEGGASDLLPAADGLVADLYGSAFSDARGFRFWHRGDPHLNTAFAVATLVTAGEVGDIVKGGVDYLAAEQDPELGSWEAGPFFGAYLDNGWQVRWVSAALTTAIALEALVKYELLAGGG